MSNFDIQKFLIENKLTINSRKIQENSVDPEIATDPRFINRPAMSAKRAMQVTAFYLDQKVKYDDFIDTDGEFVEPLGDPNSWQEDTAADLLEFYFRNVKSLSQWNESLKSDEVGERIFDISIQEFLQQVTGREFSKAYEDYHSDYRYNMNYD